MDTFWQERTTEEKEELVAYYNRSRLTPNVPDVAMVFESKVYGLIQRITNELGGNVRIVPHRVFGEKCRYIELADHYSHGHTCTVCRIDKETGLILDVSNATHPRGHIDDDNVMQCFTTNIKWYPSIHNISPDQVDKRKLTVRLRDVKGLLVVDPTWKTRRIELSQLYKETTQNCKKDGNFEKRKRRYEAFNEDKERAAKFASGSNQN